MNPMDSFEVATDTFLEMTVAFKENLVWAVKLLETEDWCFHKGTTKVCQIDETGRKKRCRAGIAHHLKIELTNRDAEAIWQLFYDFFKETLLKTIERIDGNEDMGRYEFRAISQIGDEVRCSIYLPNEWNLPQIYLSGFVTARYRKVDLI